MLTFDEYSNRIGARVRFLRTHAGLSLRSFGMMVGVHHNQILSIEQGTANPSLQTLCRIAQGLDIPLSALFSEESDACGNPSYWFSRENENTGEGISARANDRI